VSVGRQWEPIETELVHGEFLLRVSRTYSPTRVRWCVIPLVAIKKYGPRWLYGGTPGAGVGKGAFVAEAKGYSSSFEKAQKDAIAMAEAMVKTMKNVMLGEVLPLLPRRANIEVRGVLAGAYANNGLFSSTTRSSRNRHPELRARSFR
jgi:hypothetical protein